MKISVISLNQVWENKEANLLLCEQYIKESNLKKADLIIFPEMTLTGFSINIKNISEDRENSKTINSFKVLAKKYKIAVLFGVVIKNNKKALNKSIFIDNQGDILGEYAKIHPFSFLGEGKYFDAGESLTFVKYKDLNIGLSICYDFQSFIVHWPKRAILLLIFLIGLKNELTTGIPY